MGSDRRVAPGVVMGTSWVRVWRVKNLVPSYVVGETVREIVVRGGEKRIIAKEGEWVIGTDSLRRVSGTRDIPEMGDGQRREWLATSVDARQAAVGCWPHGKVDGTVELWDMQKRERLAALDATVRAWPDGGARFSADGALLVVQELHVNNDLKVFDAATGRLLRTIRMSGRQRACAFAGARQTVSVGSGARVVDIGTGREVRRWAAGSMEAQDRAVAVGGGQIATAGEDRMIHLWDMEGRERVRWTAHTSDVTALAFDEAGQVLYSGAEDGSVKVWDLGKIRAEVARLGVSW